MNPVGQPFQAVDSTGFPARRTNWGLESPQNRQAGMPALRRRSLRSAWEGAEGLGMRPQQSDRAKENSPPIYRWVDVSMETSPARDDRAGYAAQFLLPSLPGLVMLPEAVSSVATLGYSLSPIRAEERKSSTTPRRSALEGAEGLGMSVDLVGRPFRVCLKTHFQTTKSAHPTHQNAPQLN